MKIVTAISIVVVTVIIDDGEDGNNEEEDGNDLTGLRQPLPPPPNLRRLRGQAEGAPRHRERRNLQRPRGGWASSTQCWRAEHTAVSQEAAPRSEGPCWERCVGGSACGHTGSQAPSTSRHGQLQDTSQRQKGARVVCPGRKQRQGPQFTWRPRRDETGQVKLSCKLKGRDFQMRFVL